MTFNAPVFAFLLLTAAFARPALADTVADTDTVEHLISAYHQSVTGHDGARLTTLFVPSGSAWFTALSNASLASAHAKDPAATRIHPGSVAGFAKLVSTSKAQFDPQQSNLEIRTDGLIATVTFDFRFLIDGKVQNRGAESWQLVKGDEGWRIASIIYSARPPSS